MMAGVYPELRGFVLAHRGCAGPGAMTVETGSLATLNVFRSFLVGAVGVLGAVLVNPSILQKLPGDGTGVGTVFNASLLFGLSVTLGTLAYAFHRAVIYPVVLRWIFAVLCVFGPYPLHWSLFKPLGCPIVREARKTLWLAPPS
jgi:hypothetical protein